MGEQLRRLRALGIPYDVTPGVPSFAAAAAALGVELTLPGLAQSVVLTRTEGRATQMPARETLPAFAATGATLALHLSIHLIDKLTAELIPHYGADCPVAVVWRATWPDQRIIRATLATLAAAVPEEVERTALILVGPALAQEGFEESRLYAGDYDRRYRPVGTASALSGHRRMIPGLHHLGPGSRAPARPRSCWGFWRRCATGGWRCSPSRTGRTTSTRPFTGRPAGAESFNLDSWAMPGRCWTGCWRRPKGRT